jgi:hypothetical protein
VSRLAVGDRVIGPAGDGVVVASQRGADGPEVKVEWPGGASRWYPVGMLTRKRGVPKLADSARRKIRMQVLLTESERTELAARASSAGLDLSDYVRSRILTP